MAASSSKTKARRKSACNCGCAADAAPRKKAKKSAAKKKTGPKTVSAKKPAARKKAAAKKTASKKKAPRRKAAKKTTTKKKVTDKAAAAVADEQTQVAAEAPQDLKLAGKLDISGIAALRGRLLAAIETGESLTVDAGAVDSVDTASLQLLAAFANKARKRAQLLTWPSVSDALRERAALLDLDQTLDLDGIAALEQTVDLCPVY